MHVRHLRFSVETIHSAPLYKTERTTKSTYLRVSMAPGLLALDMDEQARILDFERQREVRLDHAKKLRDEVSLFARVHDCVAGYISAVHVLDVSTAGGVDAFGKLWQLQAAYGIRPAGQAATPIPERTDDGDRSTWSIEGCEIAHFRPSEHTLDRRDLARLLAHASPMHPDVATELIGTGRIPAELRTQSHFPGNMVDRRFVLLEVLDDVAFDLEPALSSYAEAPPLDDMHALARKRFDGPRPDHLAAARAALDDGRLVEAQLASLAHTLSELDTIPAQDLLREINARTWRFSPVRRLYGLLELTRDRKQVTKRIAALDKLHRKAGAYQHMLDVFIGEHQIELGDYDGAFVSFGRALQADPYLTGPWVSLGRVHVRRIEFERAWQCWDQALRQQPQHKIVRTALDWCQKLMTDFPQFF